MTHPRHLAQGFVTALRANQSDLPLQITGDLNPVVRIPAQHPEVGAITIDFVDGEVTIGIGDHFHCHFDPVNYRRQNHPDPSAAAVNAAAKYVDDFLSGRVLFHIVFVNGAYGGSGTSYLDAEDPLANVPPGAKLYTWAGPWPRAI